MLFITKSEYKASFMSKLIENQSTHKCDGALRIEVSDVTKIALACYLMVQFY